MPTITVDKYKLFEALGKKYVFFNSARLTSAPPSSIADVANLLTQPTFLSLSLSLSLSLHLLLFLLYQVQSQERASGLTLDSLAGSPK
jgi:hypothetical protein